VVLGIFNIIAASGFLTALECTKFVFGQGSAPGPTGRAYSAPPDPLAGLMGPILLRVRGVEDEISERKGRGEGKRKRSGGTGPPFANFWIRV